MSIKVCHAEALGNRFIMLLSESDVSPKDIIDTYWHKLPIQDIDQIVIIQYQENPILTFVNRDGSRAEACGNGTRCAALWLFNEQKQRLWHFQTGGGSVLADVTADDEVTLQCPKPKYYPGPTDIDLPLLHASHHIGVGNPHLVLWPQSKQSIDIHHWGPILEKHPYFTNRTNVSFATIEKENTIYLKVWERGAGATLSCGTGACATHVSANLHNLVGKTSSIHQAGGTLMVSWEPGMEHLFLTGSASLSRRLTAAG